MRSCWVRGLLFWALCASSHCVGGSLLRGDSAAQAVSVDNTTIDFLDSGTLESNSKTLSDPAARHDATHDGSGIGLSLSPPSTVPSTRKGGTAPSLSASASLNSLMSVIKKEDQNGLHEQLLLGTSDKRNLIDDLKLPYTQTGVFKHQCSWPQEGGTLTTSFQKIIRVMRRVNRVSFLGGDGEFLDCFATEPGTQSCTAHSDCFGASPFPRYCSKTSKRCLACYDDDGTELCDDKGSHPPVTGECFNVCPVAPLGPGAACAVGLSQLFFQGFSFLARKLCADKEGTGSYFDSVVTGRNIRVKKDSSSKWVTKVNKILLYVFKGTNILGGAASAQITGLSVKAWAKSVAFAFYAIHISLYPIKGILFVIKTFIPQAGSFYRMFSAGQDLLKRPYKAIKKADDEVTKKCVLPCSSQNPNGRSYNPNVFGYLKPDEKQKLIDGGFVAAPWKVPYDDVINANKRDAAMCSKTTQAFVPFGKGRPGTFFRRTGFVMQIEQFFFQLQKGITDIQTLSELYFLFIATPVEDFLCKKANDYDNVEKTLDELCIQDYEKEEKDREEYTFCDYDDSSTRLLHEHQQGDSRQLEPFEAGLKDGYRGNLFLAQSITAAIDTVVESSLKPGVDLLASAIDKIVEALEIITNKADDILLIIATALDTMQRMTDFMEKITEELLDPFEGFISMIAGFNKLFDEVGIDVENLDIKFDPSFQKIIEIAFKPILDEFVPDCNGSIEFCLLKYFLFEPLDIDCDCFNSEECEALERDDPENPPRDCVVVLFDKIGVDLNLLDGWLDVFDLPGINVTEWPLVLEGFGVSLAGLFDLPFFEIDFDPYNDLLKALGLKKELNITMESVRILSNGTDDKNVTFACEEGYYPIVQRMEFNKGKRCKQDLSARFRYPCLDSQGIFVSTCTLPWQNFLIDACGSDSIDPYFPIEPASDNYADAVLNWLPADNIFRDYYENGLLDAQYLCWGLPEEPPLIEEVLTTPEQASSANTPNGRYTSVFVDLDNPSSSKDSNQIFISKPNKSGGFEPTKRYPKCKNVDRDTGYKKGCGTADSITQFDDDMDCITDENYVTLKFSCAPPDGKRRREYHFRERYTGDPFEGCRNDNCGIDKDYDSEAAWYTPVDAWPGKKTHSFVGSSLTSAYDYNEIRGYQPNKFPPQQRVDDYYYVIYPETRLWNACIKTYEDKKGGSKLGDGECSWIDGEIYRQQTSRLGSVENVLMRRQYKGPKEVNQNMIVCPAGREIFLEHYELEPCVDQVVYGPDGDAYNQGYCSFRASMGDLDGSYGPSNRFESMCTGQRACNEKCGTDNTFFGCNCRDNNCVTANGNYLHKVWKNLEGGDEVATFDEFLQTQVDKSTAYHNWGSCSYWIVGGLEEDNEDRKHVSHSVETGTDADSNTGKEKFATLKDCISRVREEIAEIESPGKDRKRCERVFEPLSTSCNIDDDTSERGLSRKTIYKPVTKTYANILASLESSCGDTIRECGGERTCDITSCTANVGVFQHTCLRPADSGEYGQVSVAFVDSMRDELASPRKIVCPANSVDMLGVASYGKPFEQEDVSKEFFEDSNFCKKDGSTDEISCEVSAKKMAVLLDESEDMASGKTLRVDYTCICGDHFYPIPSLSTGECDPCPSGSARVAGVDNTCLPCPKGTYFASIALGCVECPPGTYCEATGSTEFKLCPAYLYNPESGSKSLADCKKPPENYYAVATEIQSGGRRLKTIVVYTTLERCPGGSERLATDVECKSCAKGSYRNADSDDGCVPCPAGFQSNAVGDDCIPCQPGHYSTQGSAACLPCNLGCYAEGTNNTQCSRCPFGFTTFGTGQSECPVEATQISSNLEYDEDGTCEDYIAEIAGTYTYLLQEETDIRGETKTLTPKEAEDRRRGNGLCDPILNVAICDYDGGDCCEATCLGLHDKEYPDIYSFYLDYKESTYLQSLENNLFEPLLTNATLTLLIEGLMDRVGEIFDAINSNVTEMSEALFLVANETFSSYDQDPPEDEREASINMTESENSAAGYPFDIDAEVFSMADLDADGEVVVYELNALFWDLFDVFGAKLDARSYDKSCQSFQCLDPDVLFGDAECVGDELVIVSPNGSYKDECLGKEVMLGDGWFRNDPEWRNGRCDEHLNHESCDYDGGDCCITTCVFNPCIESSCRSDSLNCRDPDSLVDKQKPRLSPRQENVKDETVEPDAIPKPLLVTATDNMPCAQPEVMFDQAVIPGSCDTRYTLERVWRATDAANNEADPLKQTLTVMDQTAPRDLYLNTTFNEPVSQLPVLCILDKNWKWIAIKNASKPSGTYNVENPDKAPNNVEADPSGLQAKLLPQYEENELQWKFYDAASVTVDIVSCTNSECGSSVGCYYNKNTDTLYLRASLRTHSDNIYTITANVKDDCGNAAEAKRQVIVPVNTKGSKGSNSFETRYDDLCSKDSPYARKATINTKYIEGLDYDGSESKASKAPKGWTCEDDEEFKM